MSEMSRTCRAYGEGGTIDLVYIYKHEVMEIFDHIAAAFPDKGGECAICGKAMVGTTAVRPLPRGFDFADAVHHAGVVLATPAYRCENCGAVICGGCVPVHGGLASCKKCGSKAVRAL